MSPTEFQQAVAIFCSVQPVTDEDIGTMCSITAKCGQGNKPFDLPHVLSCPGLSARIARHDAIRDDFVTWLQRKKYSVSKEKFVIPGRDERMDVVIRGMDGIVYWCDIGISEPGGPSHVLAGSDRRAGVAAAKTESNKMSKWRPLAPSGVICVPMGFESTGRWGEQTTKLVEKLMGQSEHGPSRATLTKQWSITMQKLNVAMLAKAGRKMSRLV